MKHSFPPWWREFPYISVLGRHMQSFMTLQAISALKIIAFEFLGCYCIVRHWGRPYAIKLFMTFSHKGVKSWDWGSSRGWVFIQKLSHRCVCLSSSPFHFYVCCIEIVGLKLLTRYYVDDSRPQEAYFIIRRNTTDSYYLDLECGEKFRAKL
jgi:hypothetical protein